MLAHGRAAALCAALLASAYPLPSSAADTESAKAADALDVQPRTLPEGEPLPCERAAPALVRYTGEQLRYQKPLQVHPLFRARLPAFERIVRELSERYYGRSPRKIVHLGAYSCRRMRRYPTWVSEHALGNAVDIAGFDFGPLPRRATAPARAALERDRRERRARGISARARPGVDRPPRPVQRGAGPRLAGPPQSLPPRPRPLSGSRGVLAPHRTSTSTTTSMTRWVCYWKLANTR
jgi:hypothetical protein